MALASAWNNLADRNPAVRFVDFNLRGSGQVMFQNNPVTGLLILIGVWWGGIAEGIPGVGIGATVALVVGTVTAMVLRVDTASLRQGQFGFSPLLTGAALPSFLDNSVLLWVYLVVGAALTTVVTLALSNVLKGWGIPPLTFPFVLTSWFLVLAAYQFFRIGTGDLGPPALPASPDSTTMSMAFDPLVPSILKGVSQVFLIGNWVAGLIILVGLAFSSWWAAGYAALGAVGATLLAIWFSAPAPHIEEGLFGFSAVLTAIALGCTFFRPSLRVFWYAAFGIAFTVFIQAALDTALSPMGIPSFTAPFVFATWLFLLPKPDLAPQPHHRPITGGVPSAQTS